MRRRSSPQRGVERSAVLVQDSFTTVAASHGAVLVALADVGGRADPGGACLIGCSHGGSIPGGGLLARSRRATESSRSGQDRSRS